MENPKIDEQDVCKSCGICCDGTLFGYVKLRAADDEGSYSELGLSGGKGRLQFDQPCSALKFNGDCGIYPDRPCSCREFSCKLLKRFRKGELTREDVTGFIELARKHKSELVEKARETGEFSDSQLKVFRLVIEHIESDLF